MQNINSKAGPLSAMAFAKNLSSLPALAQWVEGLPYGRNTDRSDYELVLSEERGTCSTKHALVKAIAEENNWKGVELCLGFFMMSALNTPQIGTVLASHQLSTIPEAHTYLRINGKFTDLTGINTRITETDIGDEMEIEPGDIGILKEVMHKGYLAQWAEDENLSQSPDELWQLREECIQKLAKGS